MVEEDVIDLTEEDDNLNEVFEGTREPEEEQEELHKTKEAGDDILMNSFPGSQNDQAD